jgi:hypothetical protein
VALVGFGDAPAHAGWLAVVITVLVIAAAYVSKKKVVL